MISILEYITSYFAKPKRGVIVRTETHVDQVIDHLIKLFVFPKSQSIDHWKKEIISHLMYTQRPKIKNNIKVKQSRYFEILFSEPVDPKEPYYNSYLWFAIRDTIYDDEYKNEYSEWRKPKSLPIVNEELCDILYDKIKNFMMNISKYMSDRTLSKEKIQEELNKFIN